MRHCGREMHWLGIGVFSGRNYYRCVKCSLILAGLVSHHTEEVIRDEQSAFTMRELREQKQGEWTGDYGCPVCGETFQSWTLLESHLRVLHRERWGEL